MCRPSAEKHRQFRHADPLPDMNWTNILTIYGKELRDMLRDRRTLLSMIVIPSQWNWAAG